LLFVDIDCLLYSNVTKNIPKKFQIMATAKIKYLGNLRTEATHTKSGKTFITDAPTDNNGKGEAFSPTDTVCAALASCMLTLIGITANKHSFAIGNMAVEVRKHMASNPRRISKVEVDVTFTNKEYSDKEKTFMEVAAINCPVAKSLHPDIEQVVNFNYN
jgi:uncharacterized OsmC-like protein